MIQQLDDALSVLGVHQIVVIVGLGSGVCNDLSVFADVQSDGAAFEDKLCGLLLRGDLRVVDVEGVLLFNAVSQLDRDHSFPRLMGRDPALVIHACDLGVGGVPLKDLLLGVFGEHDHIGSETVSVVFQIEPYIVKPEVYILRHDRFILGDKAGSEGDILSQQLRDILSRAVFKLPLHKDIALFQGRRNAC